MTRWFVAKAWLGGTGLVGGLTGLALGWRPLVYVAVGLLFCAFVLRFVESRAREP